MAVCCCVLAGTAACQHCSNNPMATDVWTNTVTTDHTEAKPFGDGLDVCPVCGKPSTIGKPMTNGDRIRAMSDEELAAWLCDVAGWLPAYEGRVHPLLEWLKEVDYKTEVIRRCAEANGPCWECAARGECLMWEEADDAET